MRKAAYLLVMALALVACSTGADTLDAGIRTFDPRQAQEVIEQAPAGLVVLDVRTPEEFAEGHLDGAVNLDFYAADFADQLAALDPEAPYVMYCRSGNRSGSTKEIMASLGFADVVDIGGGIVGWAEADLPISG